MDEIEDILQGRGERDSDFVEAKPRRRSKDVTDALTLMIYCVTLLAYEIREGPLRTKILELAAKAKKVVQT